MVKDGIYVASQRNAECMRTICASHKPETTFKKIIDELHMIILSETFSQIINSAQHLNYTCVHFWIIINEKKVVNSLISKTDFYSLLDIHYHHPLNSLKEFNSQVNQSSSGK